MPPPQRLMLSPPLAARTHQRLDSLPLRGRRVPEYERDDVREVQEHPYRVRPDAVQVLTVMHERQLLPDEQIVESRSAGVDSIQATAGWD